MIARIDEKERELSLDSGLVVEESDIQEGLGQGESMLSFNVSVV